MFEIFATISDDYGVRSVSTGRGFFLETSAYDEMKVMQKTQKDVEFYVDYVPSDGEWNSY